MYAMAGIIEIQIALELEKFKRDKIEYARINMHPEMFKEYMKELKEVEKEVEIERRHRELCASIEKAGKNANFWN